MEVVTFSPDYSLLYTLHPFTLVLQLLFSLG